MCDTFFRQLRFDIQNSRVSETRSVATIAVRPLCGRVMAGADAIHVVGLAPEQEMQRARCRRSGAWEGRQK